jgi:signal transduction histidine kinase
LSTASNVRLDDSLLDEDADDLYEHAPCGYVSTLPDGTIARANETFLGWTGLPRPQVVGQTRIQDLFTVSGRIYHETHVAPLLRMQGQVNEIALEIACRDRGPLPVLVTAVQKRDPSGEPLFNRYTIFNATERRRYEQQLLLERRRAERADNDMRTPLGAIGMAVQFLEKTSPTPQQAKFLRILHSSGAALLSLANQILEYARIDAGHVMVADAPFDPRALLREAADAFGSRADEKGLALSQDVDASVPAQLSGDAMKIQQVVSNLIGNAVKFTGAGRVAVSMRILEAGKDAATVEIAVADTGIGIPQDRIGAIFEEFTQATAEIGRTYGGTGLGLTICSRLADALGGKLAVESELGKGSTFTFILPLRLVR